MYGCDPWKDKEDAIERRLDVVESKNLDQDNAIDLIRDTMPNASVVDTLTIDVNALQDEKLDNEYMDEDIHFGPITITKDGTAIIASFDAINPITGAVTPLSFTLPGATSTDAGVMDASSVTWITNAEARISALEGLSDVKALVGLSETPTQSEINTAWMDEVGKAPETGDLVQDVSNAKLWIYITDTWTLYGTVVTVPLATTTSLGGVKDTSLTAPGNRWYCHVEADGRLSLIGGDTLSTLVDTTIPGIQSGKQDKLTFDSVPVSGSANPVKSGGVFNALSVKASKTEVNSGLALKQDKLTFDSVPTTGSTNPVTSGGVKTALDGKQATLTFDSAPTTGSTNPVTSGGVYTALGTKQNSFTLYEHTIRVWNTVVADKVRFSLTVLNQSPTAFTLPTLWSYLGSAADDFKQCSGVILIGGGTNTIYLIGVRGSYENEFLLEGVNMAGGSIEQLGLNWMQVTVLIADKVRQIV